MNQKQIDVILVNDQDQPLGFCEKLEAHETGALHRAISVFLTSTGTLDCHEGNLVLLQQRASTKYHSPNLWSNAACTHPLEGETAEQAAHRALKTELGIEVDHLDYQGHFIYKTPVSTTHVDGSKGENLIEHEFDHVFVGRLNPSSAIPFNPNEVGHVRWTPLTDIHSELDNHPEEFTHWYPYLLRFLGSQEKAADYRL